MALNGFFWRVALKNMALVLKNGDVFFFEVALVESLLRFKYQANPWKWWFRGHKFK